jgi:hypothetical protein
MISVVMDYYQRFCLAKIVKAAERNKVQLEALKINKNLIQKTLHVQFETLFLESS